MWVSLLVVLTEELSIRKKKRWPCRVVAAWDINKKCECAFSLFVNVKKRYWEAKREFGSARYVINGRGRERERESESEELGNMILFYKKEEKKRKERKEEKGREEMWWSE